MLGIHRAVDRGCEDDAPAFLQADESVTPAWRFGRQARAGDRDQPAAIGETRECRGDMAKGGVGHAAETFAMTENGGFISATLGAMPAPM